MTEINKNRMLLTSVVAVVIVLFASATIGTSLVGPGPGPAVSDQVYVDIKPGSCPNPMNVKSGGVLPVAVLGTEEFDVADIDVNTVQLTLNGTGVIPTRWCYEDVGTPYAGTAECGCHELTGDGYTDLTLKFERQELVETLMLSDEVGNTIPLTVTCTLYDGTAVEGSDLHLGTGKRKKIELKMCGWSFPSTFYFFDCI